MLFSDQSVTLTEVLDYIECPSNLSSSFGAQLEKARLGISGNRGCPSSLLQEIRALSDVSVIRCVDGLIATAYFGSEFSEVNKLSRRLGTTHGDVAVKILRTYLQWKNMSDYRACAEVYAYLRTVMPELRDATSGEVSVWQAFREKKSKRALKLVEKLYTQSETIVMTWVTTWNINANTRATA